MTDNDRNKGIDQTNGSGPSQAAGFRSQAGMTVERPRQEDLQASYASVVSENANPKGWYGSMSMIQRGRATRNDIDSNFIS